MLSDWIAIAAFVLSAFAFAFTAYYQVLKRPRLAILIGDVVNMYYSNDGRLRICMNITFLNEGAQYGAVVRVIGTLASQERSTNLTWQCFNDVGYTGEGLCRRVPLWRR